MTIAQSLRATGSADVLVVIRGATAGETPGPTDVQRSLARYFKQRGMSKDAALLEMLATKRRPFSARGATGKTTAATAAAVRGADSVHYYPNLGLALGSVDRQGLAALKKDPTVVKVAPAPQLRLIRPVAVKPTGRSGAGYTWGLKALKIDQLHAMGLTGRGVLVGHLDTGVDASHPALQGVVSAFAEFDAIGNAVPGARRKDTEQHGTHTAGTIAGQETRNVQFGVAPGAKLASAVVIEGGNALARILAGMDWVVAQRVRVLSMSLGLIGLSDSFLAITRILRRRGVLPVFAVGNEGPSSSRYPGNYPEALSVGASDPGGSVADFSSSETFLRRKDPTVPDIVAPGVDVLSCVPGGKYMLMSGSSMAVPHIAGLAALLMEARPKKTIAQIEAAIFKSANLTSTMEGERANRGLPDGPNALDALC